MVSSNRTWLSLLLILLPSIALACLGAWLVLASPSDVPLWRNGTVENGRLAAGLGVLVAQAWSLVRALSRIAEKFLD
jgi:hypothetical protein